MKRKRMEREGRNEKRPKGGSCRDQAQKKDGMDGWMDLIVEDWDYVQ